jgi:hypothetical protein
MVYAGTQEGSGSIPASVASIVTWKCLHCEGDTATSFSDMLKDHLNVCSHCSGGPSDRKGDVQAMSQEAIVALCAVTATKVDALLWYYHIAREHGVYWRGQNVGAR